jgi:hypothetical protein
MVEHLPPAPPFFPPEIKLEIPYWKREFSPLFDSCRQAIGKLQPLDACVGWVLCVRGKMK